MAKSRSNVQTCYFFQNHIEQYASYQKKSAENNPNDSSNDMTLLNEPIVILENPIGEGNFSIVYSGKYIMMDVAVKISTKKSVFDNELSILKVLTTSNRPLEQNNIIGFWGAYQTMHGPGLVFDLAHSTLRTVLSDSSFPFNLNTSLSLFLDVCVAVRFVHGHDIIHGDIHAGNVLLHVRGDRVSASLADFGQAALEDELPLDRGAFRYQAPELLSTPYHIPSSKKVDIYSLGLLLWEMIYRQIAFFVFTDKIIKTKLNSFREAVVNNDVRPSIDYKCPPSFANLMTSMWHKTPAERPDAHNCIEQLRAAKF